MFAKIISKRTIAFALIFAMIFCFSPMRVDAAIVYSDVPEDKVSIIFEFQEQDVDNNIATDTYVLDSGITTDYDLQYQFTSGWSSNSAFPVASGTKEFDIGSSGTYYGVTVDYYISHYNLFSLTDLPSLEFCTFGLIYNYDFYVAKTSYSPTYPEITVEYRLTCYDGDGFRLTDFPVGTESVCRLSSNGTPVVSDLIYFVVPDGTAFIVPYVRFIVPHTLSLHGFYVRTSDACVLKQSYSLDDSGSSGDSGDTGDSGDAGDTGDAPSTDSELEDKLDDVQNAIDGLPEKEQQAADSQGNSSIDGVLEVVPDHSQGFMDAIGLLAGAMAYDGVDAVLTTPAVKFPALSGVVSSFELMPSYDIDFGWWVQQLPDGILTLIQCLLTIALVVYCFRELYGTISYLFTLRGGSD